MSITSDLDYSARNLLPRYAFSQVIYSTNHTELVENIRIYYEPYCREYIIRAYRLVYMCDSGVVHFGLL